MAKVHFKIVKPKISTNYVLEVTVKGAAFAEIFAATQGKWRSLVEILSSKKGKWRSFVEILSTKEEAWPADLISDKRCGNYFKAITFLAGVFGFNIEDYAQDLNELNAASQSLVMHFTIPAAMVKNHQDLKTCREFVIDNEALPAFLMNLKRIKEQAEVKQQKQPLTLKLVAKTIGAALLGFVMGIPAAFIPGYWYLWHNFQGSFAGAGVLCVYLFTLPFFMLWHMGKGLIHGALNGFKAALIYPITLNGIFYREDTNRKLSYLLEEWVEYPNDYVVDRGIFTPQQETQLERLLASEQIPLDRRTQLQQEFRAYKEYLVNTTCVFTGRALKEVKAPVCLHQGTHQFVCEMDEIKQFIKRFRSSDQPLALTVIDEQKTIYRIHNPQISQWSRYSFPQNIQQFIEKARTLLSSAAIMCKALGVTNKNVLRTVAVPQDQQISSDTVVQTSAQRQRSDPHADQSNPLPADVLESTTTVGLGMTGGVK